MEIKKFIKRTFILMSIFVLGLLYKTSIPTVKAEESINTGPIEYACIVEGSSILPPDVKITMMVTPHMNLPEAVKPNSEFAATKVSADIEVDLMGVLNDLRALINPFNGKANVFNIKANGQTKNAVGSKGSAFPETPHSASDQWIPFNVPGVTTSFKAGEEDLAIQVGTIKAEIESSLATLPVTCEPQGNTTVAIVKVDEDADDYVLEPEPEPSPDPEPAPEPEPTPEPEPEPTPNPSPKVDPNPTPEPTPEPDPEPEPIQEPHTTDDPEPTTKNASLANEEEEHTLPKTATDNPTVMLYGSVLIAIGMFISFIRSRLVH